MAWCIKNIKHSKNNGTLIALSDQPFRNYELAYFDTLEEEIPNDIE